MATPSGYADCSIQISRADMTRPAYVTFGVSTGLADPIAVAALIQGTIPGAGGFVPFIDVQCSVTEVRVSLGTASGEDVVGTDSTITAGTKALTAMPPNVAALVHKTTARGGRRGRGRMFIPWALGSSDVNENGTLVPASRTTLQTAVNAWTTKLQVAGVGMVILHAAGKSTPGTPNVVTGFTVDNIVSTQRRRLGR